jgi:hypothetical protein
MKPVVTVILAASVAVCLTSADCGAENGQTVSQGGDGHLAAEVKRQIDRCWFDRQELSCRRRWFASS